MQKERWRCNQIDFLAIVGKSTAGNLLFGLLLKLSQVHSNYSTVAQVHSLNILTIWLDTTKLERRDLFFHDLKLLG